MVKKINLIVTGGIAACKAKNLYLQLSKKYDVNLIITKNSKRFIDFSDIKYWCDIFDNNSSIYDPHSDAEHLQILNNVILNIVYPASYNWIGKIANGIADDMASLVFAASQCKTLIFPSMNSGMYLNKILQNNKQKLIETNKVIWIEPKIGKLANRQIGIGRALEVDEVIEIVDQHAHTFKNLINKKVLLNFGRTRTYLDSIRYLTNSSSGKMGYALQSILNFNCKNLVSIFGDVDFNILKNENNIYVKTNLEMLEEMKKHFFNSDIIICSAALNDYETKNVVKEKIEKNTLQNLNAEFIPSIDVLKELGKLKTRQFLVGFSLQYNFNLDKAWKKIQEKNLNMLIVNLTSAINSDMNKVKILIAKTKEVIDIKEDKKNEIAFQILKVIDEVI